MPNKITFIRENICENGRREKIFEGSRSVFELLGETDFGGMPFDFPCGGKKRCGKCQIKIASGHEFVSPPDETESKFLSGMAGDIRYACMCEVFGDVEIELDVGSAPGKMEIMTQGRLPENIVPDRFKKVAVELSAPTLSDPLPREKNLILALNGALGAELKSLPFPLIKKLSVIQGQKIEAVLCGDELIDIKEPGDCAEVYGAAVDIGTTTAAVYLYSLTGGQCLGVAAAENPQRAYGADVISRINHTIENPEGLGTLRRLILSLVFGLVEKLCHENGIDQGDVCYFVLTGNTVMQHIAAGISPKTIAFTPFSASTLFGFETGLADLLDGSGISGGAFNKNAKIYFPPALASYVGGDIATGIIASETDQCDNLRLFLDIGTNGEIGLGNKDRLVFCATATGPAFEGAHIKLGMAGIPGAVKNIYLDASNRIAYETIGDKKPTGICGSGIIDAVALMLELGVVDETGRLMESGEEEGEGIPENSLCEIDGENAFMLIEEHNIYITQKDIRQIQLAKAAVAAGITTLLHYCKKEVSDIGELVLAGGFGSHIDKKSACRIGLIPAELEDKIIVAGNTAGTGAAAVLLDRTAAGRTEKLAEISTYIELSGDAFWMDEYVDKMMF